MGSQSKIHLAYIAGFLDGDGSLMLQIKKRKDGKSKQRIMATICFYQDSRHEKYLFWIKKILKIGYISRRNDGMTELRINGFKQVLKIINCLLPYIKFKKHQAVAIKKALELLLKNNKKKIAKKELLKIINCIMIIQNNNYTTKTKKKTEDFLSIFGLTP